MANEEAVIQGIVIPKGTIVNISICSMHYDPEYWPDPDRFDPDRWVQAVDADSSTFNTFSVLHLPKHQGLT